MLVAFSLVSACVWLSYVSVLLSFAARTLQRFCEARASASIHAHNHDIRSIAVCVVAASHQTILSLLQSIHA